MGKRGPRPKWLQAGETEDQARQRLELDLMSHLSSGKSLRSWCRLEYRPSMERAIGWINENSEQYARARELGYDTMAEEILEIADEVCETQVQVSQARNRIDSRRWLLSKMMPKKYGDRVDVQHSADTASFAELLEAVNRAKSTLTIENQSSDTHGDIIDVQPIEDE